ncbi:MAG: hypothetical protein ACM3UX_00015, partial [Candidatus Woesearchaeota archaeon]
ANLRLGTITLHTDGRTHFTIVRLQPGTEVLEAGRIVARAGRRGVAAVTVARGTTVLRLVRPARAARRRTRRRRAAVRRTRTVSFTG